jgi:hypothetical protein
LGGGFGGILGFSDEFQVILEDEIEAGKSKF